MFNLYSTVLVFNLVRFSSKCLDYFLELSKMQFEWISNIENEDVIKEIASMLLSIDKNMKVIKTEKTTSKSDGFYYIHTHQ